MAVTVSGTSITFNDATVQTTAAVTPTTAQVLSATAGATAGAVGTYMFARLGSNLAFGSTVAGSSLLPTAASWSVYKGFSTGTASFSSGAAQSGTWRAMGTQTTIANGGAYNDPQIQGATLWLRIS